LAAATICTALGGTLPASAMPVSNLTAAMPSNGESVRWVCGPFRCFWQPGPAFYAWGGPVIVGPRIWVGPRFGFGPRFRRWGW
jgi:hypothetical protein